jgi:hypothetical protein
MGCGEREVDYDVKIMPITAAIMAAPTGINKATAPLD